MSKPEEEVGEHREAPEDGAHEKEYELLKRIREELGDALITEGTYVHVQPRRVFVEVVPDRIREVVQHLQDTFDMWQFSTLSGRDLGDDLQACYHFFLNDDKIAVTLRVTVPREKPEYPSITTIVPAAEFVENELRELYGVVTIGHPNVRRVELPENWPADEYPMRKDWADPRGLMQRSRTTGPKPKEEL
jgi:Ni,Fe-hydrogenase III component G